MSRLVIVSNRVGSMKSVTNAGGLEVALTEGLRKRGGLWFGWSGRVADPLEGTPGLQVEKVGRVDRMTVDLTREDYEPFYLGFSNRVLWPVFHYRLDLAEFEAGFIDGYRRVNRRWAELLAPSIQETDLIWVHDYHMIPFAAELRQLGVRNRIGFFLHIPLPPPQLLVAIPQHDWLFRSLFAFDLVAFQTEIDRRNFVQYAEEEAGATARPDGTLTAYDRTVMTKAIPIGIDEEGFGALTRTRDAGQAIERIRARNLNRAQIIGVDRLDYSKGLPNRFRAFRRLLRDYPENRGRIVLMQIAPPSRGEVEAYADIRRELEQLSGAINGEFADFDWTPIRYIHRHVSRTKLASLYLASQVGLVTPLRDGMNLVAQEYVAAQNPEDPGVLVLSRFAGAAETMTAALIVNPYDIDSCAENLQRALTMPLAERRERHDALLKAVRSHDVFNWQRTFVEALDRVPASLAAA